MDLPPSAEPCRLAPPLRLLFSSHEEFLEELRARRPNLEPLVRVTFRKSADASGAPLMHLTLLATYLRRLDDCEGAAPVIAVVQLAEYLGALWIDPTDEAARRCQQRAEQLRTAVARAVQELGLDVGAGAYITGERLTQADVKSS